MLTFTAGLVAGFVVGVMGSLFFLLFAHAIPDGFPRAQKEALPAWLFSAVVMVLMLAATLAYNYLHPHRLAFITLGLLFLVFLTAKMRGMLAALFTLAFASVLMSYILPPSNTIWIGRFGDRILLVVFIAFGAIVSRLVGQRPERLRN
jgi:K+-sensing histidine kinase KdpD